jgi:hypothetical protein
MRHVLCVAIQETLAEDLARAVTAAPDVLVVGVCGPAEVHTMTRVVGATLIVAPAGTPVPDRDTLGAPVLFVPQDADPAEVVRTFLVAQANVDVPAHAATLLGTQVTSSQVTVAPRRSQLRIGFYGSRGGVGTTTAAVTAARLLAAPGLHVALYDAPQRGDPALLLGLTPSEQPVTSGGITVYSGLVLDDARIDYDAIVIDGGRQRRLFPARWIALEAPLSEAEIAELLGLSLKPGPEVQS